MLNRLNFGQDDGHDPLMENAEQLEIKFYKIPDGVCFDFKLSGSCGNLFGNVEDEEVGATPEDISFLQKLIGRFERKAKPA